VLALSKGDLAEPDVRWEARAAWRERLGPDTPVIVTSAVSGLGLDELAQAMFRGVAPVPESDGASPADEPAENLAEHRVFRPAAERYRVERVGDGAYRVSGRSVERLVARYDLDNEDALAHLERRLRGIGVIGALEAHGFEPGDEVLIGDVAFELDPTM
jgi:GTPase